jgi:hypothetical protein
MRELRLSEYMRVEKKQSNGQDAVIAKPGTKVEQALADSFIEQPLSPCSHESMHSALGEANQALEA